MRALLVEDAEDVADAIVQAFARKGRPVDHAPDCALARDMLNVQTYDVAILDINLPDGSGLDLLKWLRDRQDSTPVLMLTARLDVEDRVQALDSGADDYLMKPFDLRELEARVRALLRRGAEERSGRIEFADLVVDPAGQTAQVNGVHLVLTRREFALLEVFVANRGRVMSKDRLHQKLFAFDEEDIGVNAIELYVGRLRRKLDGSQASIRTLRGLGYQLHANAADDAR